MCDHDILIEKYEEHRKVHQKFLRLFNNIIETALCMQPLVSDVNTGYDDILKLLKTQSKPEPTSTPPAPPHKRRKAHSFDSPSTVVRTDDSPALRNRSDPEVSASVLDQNINLPDSEDSFFALTQSPSREPLSPKGPTSCLEENVPRTPPKREGWFKTDLFSGQDDGSKTGEVEKKKKKGALSLSRFSSSFKMSPETSKQAELLPVRQKLATPKPKAVMEQENVAPPVGKWTAKKTTPGSARRIDSSMRKTPTSSTKQGNSLLNRTRLRQTKLKFPDSLNKSMTDEDETFFDEFVVPSPTSATVLSATRFLKSAKKKEQSSLIASHNVAKTTEKKSEPVTTKIKEIPDNDDDFDIDQTYFSEAEKDLTRSKPFARPFVPPPRVKVESVTQKKPKAPMLVGETQSDQESDTSSIMFVKPISQEEVITIEETQPSKKDLFMEAIREERRKEESARLSVLNVMGPVKRDDKQESLFPVKSDLSVLKKPMPSTIPNERRCTECTKQYQFLLNRGLPPDVACRKLPRSCRECRLAQLHETPPDFWNPEFTPTQN
ncbi:uncharacterized protein LOC135711226 [Ochlerotatus camptorhynchus]|uniref:uncharacterized protein LOC135711226 n=1 Tax=Ochlerotatus camptorhynchus TaxID=644619 RepID=UPI0031DD0D3F